MLWYLLIGFFATIIIAIGIKYMDFYFAKVADLLQNTSIQSNENTNKSGPKHYGACEDTPSSQEKVAN